MFERYRSRENKKVLLESSLGKHSENTEALGRHSDLTTPLLYENQNNSSNITFHSVISIIMSSFGDFTRQFKALAWKNYVLKTRNFGTLLLELAVPTILIIALGVLNKILPQQKYETNSPSSYIQAFNFNVNDTQYNMYYGNALCYRSYGNIVWSCQGSGINCNNINNNNNTAILDKVKATCQLQYIAVAPTDASNTAAVTTATDFVNYANTYISPIGVNNFVLWSSEGKFNSYIKGTDYTLIGKTYGAGIFFSGSDPTWNYIISVNQSYYTVCYYYTYTTYRMCIYPLYTHNCHIFLSSYALVYAYAYLVYTYVDISLYTVRQ